MKSTNTATIGTCPTCHFNFYAKGQACVHPNIRQSSPNKGCTGWMAAASDSAAAATALAKAPALKTGDDAAVAARFVELYNEAQNGLRRVVAFGLYAWHVKLNCLKHSQFGDWADAIGAAHGISYRSVRRHMDLTESVLNACGVKSLKPFLAKCQNQIGHAWPISHCGELLLLPEADVPKDVAPLREKICTLIDGKSARQLFFEFKQADETEDKPKVGRLKGQGGASKEQRAAAAAAEQSAQVKQLELETERLVKWVDDNCDDQHLGKISDAALARFLEACQLGAQYAAPVIAARAKAQKGV